MKLVPVGEAQDYETMENKPKRFSLVPVESPSQVLPQDFISRPFESTAQAIMQPAMETASGKSMRTRAEESTQTPEFSNTSKTRPYDKNVPSVGNRAFGRIITGEGADVLTTPATYIGGKLIEGAAKLVPKALPKLGEALKESSAKSYGKVLGATTKGEKDISSKVTPGLVERKPLAFSRAGLQRTAQKNLELTGDELDSAWKSLPKESRVNVDPIVYSIKNRQASLLIDGKLPDANRAEWNALKAMKKDLVKTVGQGDVSPQVLRQYRQVLDQAVADSKRGFGLDAKGTAKIKAQRYLANDIRRELASKFPNIAKINKRFSFWNNMTDLLETTTPKAKGATSSVHAFGAVSEASGHPFIGMFANLGKLVSDNVLWNSISAATKSQLADLIAKGDTEVTNGFINKLMGKLGSEKGGAYFGGEGKYADASDPRMKYFQVNQKYVYDELVKLKPGTPEFDAELSKRYALVSDKTPSEGELGMSEVEKHNLEQSVNKEDIEMQKGTEKDAEDERIMQAQKINDQIDSLKIDLNSPDKSMGNYARQQIGKLQQKLKELNSEKGSVYKGSKRVPTIPKNKSNDTFDNQSHWITPDNKLIEGKEGITHEELLEKHHNKLGFEDKGEYESSVNEAIKNNDSEHAMNEALKRGAIRVGSGGNGNAYAAADLSKPENIQRVIQMIENSPNVKRWMIEHMVGPENSAESVEGNAKQVISQLKAKIQGSRIDPNSASQWHLKGDEAKIPGGVLGLNTALSTAVGTGAMFRGASQGMQKQAEHTQSDTISPQDRLGDIKEQLATVEQSGRQQGDYAQLTEPVITELKRKGLIPRSYSLYIVRRDSKKYDEVVLKYWDYIGKKYGIPEGDRAEYWYKPARYNHPERKTLKDIKVFDSRENNLNRLED